MKKIKVIYLHGVGGENSDKYHIMKKNLPGYYYDVIKVKQNKKSPKQTYINLTFFIEALIRSGEKIFLVGSSRGGMYANLIMQKYDIPGLLINPVLKYSQHNYEIYAEKYGDEEAHRFYSELKYVQNIIKKYEQSSNITNLFLSKNDEIVNYKKTLKQFPYCASINLTNDTHRFESFENIISEVEEIIKKYY